MTVNDTFHFENGRAVFVGLIETDAKVIPPCDCEIVVGNEIKAVFWIDGEEIPKRRQVADRAISTSQPIDLASRGLGRSGFKIRSKSCQ